MNLVQKHLNYLELAYSSFFLFCLLFFVPNTIVAQKIYWSSASNQAIYSSNLDGSDVEVVVTTAPNPFGVAVYRDKLYWTALGNSNALIQRSNLDGTGIEDIVSVGLSSPTGMDVSGNKIYWADSGSDRIQRADLDGSNVEDLIFVGGVMDVEVENGKIYWTNTNTNTIQRANLDGSNIEDVLISLNNHAGLSIHNNKIYYVEGNNVRRADLNGNNIQTLATEMTMLEDVVVFGSRMYYTNDQDSKVHSADLDGSDKVDIITEFPESLLMIDANNDDVPKEYIYVCQDSTVRVCHSPDTLIPGALFQWYNGDGDPITMASPDSCFIIMEAGTSNVGYYYCRQLDNANNIVSESPQYVVQLFSVDSLGGKYPPDQIVVEWKDTTSEATKNALQAEFAADSLGACVCGGIELWQLFPEELLVDGDPLSTIEEKVNKLRSKSGPEEVDFNFLFKSNSTKDTNNITKPFSSGILASSTIMSSTSGVISDDTVRVAVIDTGIDILHDDFNNPTENVGFLKNKEEDGMDGDLNCIIGDFSGYDFANDDSDPYDDNSHGTHVASTINMVYHLPINYGLPSDVVLELINIKSHDAVGNGFLFDEVCSFVYATEEEACIINFSAGRNGNPSGIMLNTLIKANEEAGALIITSAGNEDQSNSDYPHYPSSYELPHILEVAAGIYENDDFGIFSGALWGLSNFGPEVDIVARGNNVRAAVPNPVNNNSTDVKSGTSMAAAVVSGVAARMKTLCPELGWAEIRQYILDRGQAESTWNFGGDIKNNRVLLYDDDYFEELVDDLNCMIVNTSEPTQSELKIETFPNPYSDELNIMIESLIAEDVLIEVHDLVGRKIFSEEIFMQSGINAVVWDGLSPSGHKLPSGIYVLIVQLGAKSWSEKVIKQ